MRLTWGANPCSSWLVVLLSGLEDEAQAYDKVTPPKAERAGKEGRGSVPGKAQPELSFPSLNVASDSSPQSSDTTW